MSIKKTLDSEFKKTPKQQEAIKLLTGPAKHINLYGGSRSGKTFILCYALIVRACKTKSRHVILRHKFNHVKTSIFLDTFPKVLSLCFPECGAKANKTDYLYSFPNGSEIWFAGLDDKERTEKILGKEYSTMYFNESSQISYASILMAKTRLAEKNNLKKKLYFDCNPPSKRSWIYWLWEKGFDPAAELPVDKDDYASMVMNPKDNLDNIDEEYLDMLAKLPEKERDRFLNGLFVDADDGLVYYSFRIEEHVQDFKPIYGTYLVGIDFNVDPLCCVITQIIDNKIHVCDEIFLRNSNTFAICEELIKRGYKGARVFPDSTGRNRKTSGQSDTNILANAGFQVEYTRNPFVVDRVNNVNRLLTNRSIVIHPKCTKLINDLEKVAWKGNDLDQKTDPLLTHISDGLGYLAWSLYPIRDTSVNARIKLS